MDLCSALFPYIQQSPLVALTRATFTNADDTLRYVFDVEDGACSSITKTETAGGTQVLEEPLEFVQNMDSTRQRSPLLTKIPGSFFRIKLSLRLQGAVHASDSAIYILKTHGSPQNDQLDLDWVLVSSQLSKIDYQHLPVSGDSGQQIVVNDAFSNGLFQGCPLTVSVWNYSAKSKQYTQLCLFKVYVDETLEVAAAPVAEQVAPAGPTVGEFRSSFNFPLEDGPKLRKLLLKYEADVALFRKNWMGLHEEVRLLEHYLKRMNASRFKIVDYFHHISTHQRPLPRVRLQEGFARSLAAIFEPFDRSLRTFLTHVVPATMLQKVISCIPVETAGGTDYMGLVELAHLRKTFEARSKDYYSWLNKYLSNEKERPESKLLAKRKTFELSKFDYLNQLNAAFNNQYLNQVLENLFRFLERSETSKPSEPSETDQTGNTANASLSDELTVFFTIMSRFNSEKQQLRQLLEASRTNEELLDLLANNRLSSLGEKNAAVVVTNTNTDLVFDRAVAAETAVTAVPVDNDQIAEKSGILFALGGQGKQGWHKEWVSLSDGRLTEYSDWRLGKSPSKKPIDIALTSVKAVSHEKRQFCFQISTASGQHHIFQTFSEEERSRWLNALYNAGQQVDTARLREEHPGVKPRNLVRRKHLAKLRTDKGEERISERNGEKHAKPTEKLNEKETHAGQAPELALDSNASPISIHSKRDTALDYLAQVRADPSNMNSVCADCRSTTSVEWVSINFLTVFCVRCSLAHRSLGSHITRIRSLKLDKFADESEALLRYVSNKNVNLYLESNLGGLDAIGPDVLDADRLTFVKEKYLSKSFAEKFPDSATLLVQAIRTINIPNVAKYLACGADPNLYIRINVNKSKSEPQYRNVSLFMYSLKKTIEVESGLASRSLFVASELIILNGGAADRDKNGEEWDLELSPAAVAYWNARSMKLRGLTMS